MLELVAALRQHTAPPPDSAEALARAKQRVLASLPVATPQAAVMPSPAPRTPAPTPRPSFWQRLSSILPAPALPAWAPVALIVVLALLLSMSVSIGVSAQALPGQPLYWVKRAIERLELVLTTDPAEQARLEHTFNGRRLDEVGEILHRGMIETVSFQGEVKGREGDYWRIEKYLADIEPGVLGNISLAPGAVVSVTARTTPEGILQVMQLDLLRPAPEPEPSPSREEGETVPPVPTATATLTPTATPEIASEGQPASKPTAPLAPLVLPTATPTKRPSPTPSPSPSPTSTATLPPTATPTTETNVAVGVVTALGGGTITVNGVDYRLETALDAGVQVGRSVQRFLSPATGWHSGRLSDRITVPCEPDLHTRSSARHRQGSH